jgi:hypothetical protein
MTGKRTRYTAESKAKVALEALRGELDGGAAGGGARHPPDDGRRMEAAGRGALGFGVLRKGGGAGGGPAGPQDRQRSQWPASCAAMPPRAVSATRGRAGWGTDARNRGEMRRQRRVDDGQNIFSWATIEEASPAEASHYERPAPQAVASLRVNSATCDFTKSYMLVGVLPVSLNRSSVMRSYRPCA